MLNIKARYNHGIRHSTYQRLYVCASYESAYKRHENMQGESVKLKVQLVYKTPMNV